MSRFSWNEANTVKLEELVGSKSEVVTQDDLATYAEVLGTTTRSVGSKLRKMEYEVQKASETNKSDWSDEQTGDLIEFLDANDGQLTYAELAEVFGKGKFTAKQIQGKILSLELVQKVKKAEKIPLPRKYTEAQEAKFIELANAGAFLEEIAEALDMKLNSVRGKALSLTRTAKIAMPKQKVSTAKTRLDILDGLNVAEMTIEELVKATERTDRGIKSMLSRRGISCADYDGAAKRAKLDSKVEA